MARARRPDATGSSVDDIADELYALSPQEFTARRDELVRDAKDRGDRDTAKAIGALRKPSTSAWLANQLVRAHRDEVTALLYLGGALRQAQSRLDGDQLRELSRQRRQAVNALVRQARQLAVELGRPVGDEMGRELERTLEAALSSPDAAAHVESGRLTTALSPSEGFGAATPHLRAVPDVRPEKQQPGRREAAAKQRLAEASASVREAARELDEQAAAHDRLGSRVESLTSRITELTVELRDLEEQVAEAKRQEQQARKTVTQAERAKRRADLAFEAAQADLDR